MRSINIIKVCILSLFVSALSSCDKGFEETNRSVDFVSEPNLDYLLPDIELTMMDNTYYTNGDFVAPYVMHVANRKAYSALILPGGYHGYHFEWTYGNPLKGVVDMIYRTKDDPSRVNYNSIGRIIKAYLFHTLTDLYGDIPYFEGGMGYINRVFTPTYDPQQQIYADMFKELEEA
ncbi:MAG TPA: SusD/RagB family nutrient-binding outer membrane lipoprotein, partial [Hanamia sp.]|nr:SusD/RagB family nutrient-binding outer membrane lipoprotein [Hanamia sp.]